MLTGLRSCAVDRQVARLLVRRAPLLRCAARRPGPRHRRYQPSSSPCRRSAPRGLVLLVGRLGAPPGTPSVRHEWRVLPSRGFLPRRRPATLARRRSRHRCLQSPRQSDKEESFNTSLAQDAVAQPPSILLAVNGHPDFFAGRGMLQQQVTAFPGPDLDETRGLQLADHLGPGHDLDRKPNARLCQCTEQTGWVPAYRTLRVDPVKVLRRTRRRPAPARDTTAMVGDRREARLGSVRVAGPFASTAYRARGAGISCERRVLARQKLAAWQVGQCGLSM